MLLRNGECVRWIVSISACYSETNIPRLVREVQLSQLHLLFKYHQNVEDEAQRASNGGSESARQHLLTTSKLS